MKDTGGPAYPIVCDGDPCIILHSEGMTLRDWFAGQATDRDIKDMMGIHGTSNRMKARCLFADYMIEERDK